ncbi:MAG TPA: DUF6282 family protein [Vicinamibacterales bacterium]|jgi:hypothetical protein|nr:DUF6282 family protein [Vicinamibacterales bacterium]
MPIAAAILCAACWFGAGTRVRMAAAGGQSGLQTAWDSYKTRHFTPSVDEHLTDPALIGAIDLHAHSDPDSFPRQWDAFEVARLAKDRGLRGLVFKNHYTETAGLAWLARKYEAPGLEVFGGVALNLPVGGVNPQAVRYMADVVGHYGRIVWMPTHDSEHEVTYNKEQRPFVRISRDGHLLPEVLEVLSLIAQDDLTLATGHVSAEEALMIIREGKKRGVQRIIVTHPVLAPQYTFMSSEQLQEAVSQGAFIEIVASNFTRSPADKARALDAIRLVGPDKAFISSDSGVTGTPNHIDALARTAKVLREAGFTESALTQMFKQNPARLVKLPIL